jgi:O-antigen/teichoic acid export membrane protein
MAEEVTLSDEKGGKVLPPGGRMHPRGRVSAKLLSDSGWSLAGSMSMVLTGVVSIKLITALVPAEAYGDASLVLGVLALLSSTLVGPFMTAHGRLYFDYVERGLEGWYWKVMAWLLAGIAAAMCLLYAGVAAVNGLAGNLAYARLMVPAAVCLAVQPYYSALTNYFEAKRWQRRLAIANLLYRMVNVAALVLFVFLLPAAPAIILAQGAAGVVLLAAFRMSPGPSDGLRCAAEPSRGEAIRLAHSLARLGWWFALGWVVQWVLTTGDRYLINYYMTAKDVGSYGMNYSLWSTPYIVLNGWLEGLTRPLLYQRATRQEWRAVRRIIIQRTVTGGALAVAGTGLLYACSEVIGRVMLGPAYDAGPGLMLMLSAGHCFFVIAYSINALFLALKRPGVILLASGFGAVANVGMNIYLIPRYGLLGAGWATLLAYCLWAAVLASAAILVMRRLAGQPG